MLSRRQFLAALIIAPGVPASVTVLDRTPPEGMIVWYGKAKDALDPNPIVTNSRVSTDPPGLNVYRVTFEDMAGNRRVKELVIRDVGRVPKDMFLAKLVEVCLQ